MRDAEGTGASPPPDEPADRDGADDHAADDPRARARADVRALLAGAFGLRRAVELAAESQAERAAARFPRRPQTG